MAYHSIKLQLAAIALSLCAPALAAQVDRYVCNCLSGAQSGCAAGSNSNDGSTPALAKQTLTTVAANERWYFCKGGSFTQTWSGSAWNVSTLANPVTATSYTAWAGGTNKPLITATATNDGNEVFRITSAVGLTVDGLDINGGKTNNAPAVYIGPASASVAPSRITVQNTNMRGFGHGAYCTRLDGTPGSKSPTFIRLLDNRITDNVEGLLVGCDDALYEGNYLYNNGNGSSLHNIYVDNSSSRVTFRNNWIEKQGRDQACIGTSFVGHGSHTDLVIEYNRVIETLAAGDGGCYGIQISYGGYAPVGFTRLQVRGNIVVMAGGGSTGIEVNDCVDCVVEDNLVYMPVTADVTPIGFFVGGENNGRPQSIRAIIRNNTVYTTGGNPPDHKGYWVTGPSGGTYQFYGNAYYSTSASASPYCWRHSGSAVSTVFGTFDYNICYRAAGQSNWSDLYATMSAQQSAGTCLNCKNTNPLLVQPTVDNNWTAKLNSGSPAIDAGHPSLSGPTDQAGCPIQNGRRDMGAFERGC